jgi:hypothetical protein
MVKKLVYHQDGLYLVFFSSFCVWHPFATSLFEDIPNAI